MPPEITASQTVPQVSQTQQPTSTDAGARMEQAGRDCDAMSKNITQGYKALGAKVSGMTRSLRNESKVLGSKALFTLVSTVAGGIEHLFRLEAGHLSNKLVSNTQLARSLTEQNKAVQHLAKHTGILSRQINDIREKNPQDPQALTAYDRVKVLDQLDMVLDSLNEFRSAIDQREPGTGQFSEALQEVNNMAGDMQKSLHRYQASIRENNRLPDASVTDSELLSSLTDTDYENLRKSEYKV